MAEIRIEGLEVFGNNPIDAGHLYLVYVDDKGEEYVVRGGKSVMTGIIELEINRPIENSEDKRVKKRNWEEIPVSREDRGSMVLDLGGRDASAVWQQILAYAQKIDDAKIGYNSFGPNSNTVIIALLNHVGVTNLKLLPPAEGVDGASVEPFKFGGIDTEFFKIEPFETPRIQISSAYPGSEKEDVEYLMKKIEELYNSAPSQPLLHHPEESSQNKTSTAPHRQEGMQPSPSRTDLETPQYAVWKKRKQLSQQRRLSTPPLINITPNGRPTPVAQERSFSRRQRPNTPPLIDIMPNGRPTPPPVTQERPFSGQRPANQPSLADSEEMRKLREQESSTRVQRALHGSELPRNIRPLIPLTPPDLTALQSLEWQKSLAQAIRRQRRLREGLIHAPSLLKFSIPE